MARWLFKTEPTDYSFAKLAKEGRTRWTGVKNPTALIHLRHVKKGDEILIYHTGNEKAVVGVARALGDGNPKTGEVEIAAVRPLPAPVTLVAVKANAAFRAFPLVTMGRLSVMPVPDAVWKALLNLAGA